MIGHSISSAPVTITCFLFGYAGPLYRLALTAFLLLVLSHEIPPLTDAEAFGARGADRFGFEGAQRAIEEALLTAVEVPVDDDDA